MMTANADNRLATDHPAMTDDFLKARKRLIAVIAETMRRREISMAQAAKRCGVTPARLSKILNGPATNVQLYSLLKWLTKLGHDVEIRVKPYNARSRVGRLRVLA